MSRTYRAMVQDQGTFREMDMRECHYCHKVSLDTHLVEHNMVLCSPCFDARVIGDIMREGYSYEV